MFRKDDVIYLKKEDDHEDAINKYVVVKSGFGWVETVNFYNPEFKLTGSNSCFRQYDESKCINNEAFEALEKYEFESIIGVTTGGETIEISMKRRG